MNIRFFVDGKKINQELFASCAEQWAKVVGDEGKKERDKNKYTQVRKFYDEVLKLKQKLQTEQASVEEVLPYLKMLNAKAAYAKARKHVTDKFVDFIKESIANVKDKESFYVFTTFFEAFMGYYRSYAPKE